MAYWLHKKAASSELVLETYLDKENSTGPMRSTCLIAAIAVLICSFIGLGQGQVYEIWVKGADSSDVVGAKVYVEYGGQRPYYVGNTNAEGEIRTPSDVESGSHKVTVKKGKKCTYSGYYDFVPGRTVEVVLPCYPTPRR